ncbi:hypothetical protein SUVZ_07G2370 [Saccharomyces uvarum]|uniref:Uncharacterized protein n=1 Tax=Saccharomyces uvarum TaxID=230603 RepID=A0ABN8WVX4_SACUV|nr:hypothetical protein SUVZ_07G2370 [Saccharomyces uvarum]
MRKRSREIFMVEKKKESVWKMSIPVKRLLKPSRPGSAALGNSCDAREFEKFSHRFFRLGAAGSGSWCGVWVCACGNYRRISVSRAELFADYRKRPTRPVVGCGCSADALFTFAHLGKTCYCFPPLAGGDVNDFCAALVSEKPGCPSVPGLVNSLPFPVPSGLRKKNENVVPYPRSIRNFLRMR